MDIEDIKKALKDADSTNLFFTDLLGKLMTLNVNPDDISDIIENGIGFDGSSIPGFASIEGSDRIAKTNY